MDYQKKMLSKFLISLLINDEVIMNTESQHVPEINADLYKDFININYITLPFIRIMPYKKGVSPFDEKAWPNEPGGFIDIPVVVTSDMSEEDVMLAAILDRNKLLDKWLELGNCNK